MGRRSADSARPYGPTTSGTWEKYVPGKALVVILRAGLIRSRRVNAVVAAISVFYETLTMMAVGSFLAGAILVLRGKV